MKTFLKLISTALRGLVKKIKEVINSKTGIKATEADVAHGLALVVSFIGLMAMIFVPMLFLKVLTFVGIFLAALSFGSMGFIGGMYFIDKVFKEEPVVA